MRTTLDQSSAIASLKTELIAAGDGLADNADVLRGVLAGCGDCIKILDLDGRLQFMSEGGKRVMEVEDFGRLKGCPWPDFWAGDGNADARWRSIPPRRAAPRASRVLPIPPRARRAIGTFRSRRSSAATASPRYLLSISRDITDEWRAVGELKEAVARQELLSGELQHRIKNTLAMVGAIANQTMRGDDVKAAREGFAARLMTLSHAHDILTRTSWTAAPIKEVIDGALAPHGSGPGRIRTSGPDLLLQPKQALALSLAVHELATNAMKYGALSNGSGTVDILWSEETIETVPSFRFTWTESGGPPVSEPAPDRKGFGSRLIERMLTNDFAGKVQILYRPEGAVCELIAPRSAVANPSE